MSKKSIKHFILIRVQKVCVSSEGECLELLAVTALTRNTADREPL